MTRRATNMFVCTIRFIRLGHTYIRITPTTPKRGALWCGGDTNTSLGLPPTTEPPDGNAHMCTAKGKATLCKQIAESARPSQSQSSCVSYDCVPSMRSIADYSVKLPGNRPRDYSITLIIALGRSRT